jgi:hypothetical protein
MDNKDIGSSRPEVVENYRNYIPPANLRTCLDDLLDAVPPKYLVGLKTIVLANQSALTRDQRRQKTWSRNRKVRLAEALGSYHRAWKSSPATIWLYVDNILKSEPPKLRRLPFLRYYTLGGVLYHEIGHHIHAVHKPVHEGKENVAEDWSRTLLGQFYRRRYWYLPTLLYPVALVGKLRKRLKKSISSETSH